MTQLDLEIEALRANLKSLSEYAMKLDASNDDYQVDNEALRKELAEANAIIHTLQDGALARDQAGVIARANARIVELENACKEWQGAFEVEKGDHSEDFARAERAEEALVELERRWQTAVARAERAEAERDAMRGA